jgi:hypothetical protein
MDDSGTPFCSSTGMYLDAFPRRKIFFCVSGSIHGLITDHTALKVRGELIINSFHRLSG